MSEKQGTIHKGRLALLGVILLATVSIRCGSTVPSGEQLQGSKADTENVTSGQYTVDQPYEYPVKPGDPLWKEIESYPDKVQVLQIPETILRSMTTKALAETVLAYPLLGIGMFAYDTPENGFDHLLEEFNGLRELLNRKDAGRVLLLHYQKTDPNGFDSTWTTSDKGAYVERLGFLEILLGQPQVLVSLSQRERENLVREVFSKIPAKAKSPDGYSDAGKTGYDLSILMGAAKIDAPHIYQRFESVKFKDLSTLYSFMEENLSNTTTVSE